LFTNFVLRNLILETELSTFLSLAIFVFELMHPFFHLLIGMVSTRSERTNYTINPPNNPRPLKSQRTSIANYFLHLEGPVKSRLIKGQITPVSQLALTFNWFLQKMVPLKKVGVEETFEDLFTQVPSRFYPNFVRRTFLVKFKNDLRPFYDEIYGPFRYFDVIPDAVLGHKVIIHQNLLKHYEHKRSGIIPFHAVSEILLGSLFACPQSDLLTKFSHNSLYEFNRIKYLLVGPLYFVPHHCDSMLSFDKPCRSLVMGDDTRTVKLFAEDPHHSSFRVGDSVTVNYHMGEHASQYNFVCACGSSNCVSIDK